MTLRSLIILAVATTLVPVNEARAADPTTADCVGATEAALTLDGQRKSALSGLSCSCAHRRPARRTFARSVCNALMRSTGRFQPSFSRPRTRRAWTSARLE